MAAANAKHLPFVQRFPVPNLLMRIVYAICRFFLTGRDAVTFDKANPVQRFAPEIADIIGPETEILMLDHCGWICRGSGPDQINLDFVDMVMRWLAKGARVRMKLFDCVPGFAQHFAAAAKDIPFYELLRHIEPHPLANLDIIEREQLVARAGKVGAYFQKILHETLADHPLVGNVRGVGMVAGMEGVAIVHRPRQLLRGATGGQKSGSGGSVPAAPMTRSPTARGSP